MKYERMVCRTRKMKIITLEEKITGTTTFPKNFNKYKEVLEEKDKDIAFIQNSTTFQMHIL